MGAVSEVREPGVGETENFDNQFTISSTLISQSLLSIHDIVSIDGSLVALASTPDALIGTILRSDDGGLTWTGYQSLPKAEELENAEYETVADLMVAGSWLVAIRSVDAGSLELSGVQSVALSTDLGSTWQQVDLPVPDGTIPLVLTAIESAGQLVLGGTAQAVLSEAEARGQDDEYSRTDDAALWVTGTDGFERLAASQFDGQPLNQQITELVAFDGRLIAVGESTTNDMPNVVAWESSLGGLAWQHMDGLPGSDYSGESRPAVVRDGSLVLRFPQSRVTLARGSSTWVSGQQTSDAYYSTADEVTLPDGSVALTMTDDSICNGDCSLAYGGRVDNDVLTPTQLSFENCDTDPQGDYRSVTAPALIGNKVAAMASCNGRAALAYSPNGGASWKTVRLNEIAPRGSDLSLMSSRGPDGGDYIVLLLPDDGALVAVMWVSDTIDYDAPDSDPLLGQVLVMRISASD